MGIRVFVGLAIWVWKLFIVHGGFNSKQVREI